MIAIKNRIAGLIACSLLACLGTLSAQSGPQPCSHTLSLGMESTSMGSLVIRWNGTWDLGEGWEGSLSASLGIPVVLSIQGGLDTARLDMEAQVQKELGDGFFVQAGLGSGFSTQSQVLGVMDSWMGRASLKAGIKTSGVEIALAGAWDAALFTAVLPSDYLLAAWADRGPMASPGPGKDAWIGLPLASQRISLGLEGTVDTTSLGDALWFNLSMLPSLWPHMVGPLDGFSFGELPFLASLGYRFSL